MADRNANMCVGHGLRELVGFPLLQGAPMLRDYRGKCTGMRFSLEIFSKLLRAFLSRKTHSGSRQVDSFSPVLLVSERGLFGKFLIADTGVRTVYSAPRQGNGGTLNQLYPPTQNFSFTQQ